MMATTMQTTGRTVDSIPMEIPWMTLVAGPVSEDSAMDFTGLWSPV